MSLKSQKFLKFLIIILIVLGLFLVLFFTQSGLTFINQHQSAKLVYIYDNISIDTQIDDSDFQRIKSMFNLKTLAADNPSCGFTEDISLRIGDNSYCIARDECPIIKDSNANKYFGISRAERDELDSILEKYGAHFPCV